jgi:hypothetical protein
MQHEWERREMHANFLKENLKETGYLEDLNIDERMILHGC